MKLQKALSKNHKKKNKNQILQKKLLNKLYLKSNKKAKKTIMFTKNYTNKE